MSKALTKEDLIYILQAVLKLSQNSDNALRRADDDGLYVKDYTNDLKAHTNDTSTHVTQDILDVLSHIDIDSNDELTYDGKQLMTYISKEANNAIIKKDDGLYVPAFKLSTKTDNSLTMETDGLYNKNTDASSHIQNNDIHVTQADKDGWNSTLTSANKHTDQAVGQLPIHDFCFTTELPNVSQDEKTLYFLADDPDRPLECTYTVHIYRDGKYHVLGVTKKTLNKYLTIDQFKKAAKDFIHDNQEVIDALSEDEYGTLCYKGQNIFSNSLISPEDYNAIVVKDGKLYVRDYTQEIESMQKNTAITKTNLYNEEISTSGKYKLKDTIDNYSLILVEYYYKPDNPDKGTPGCIQTACIDTDTLRDAYSMGMLYILQYGYGVMTSNSQIHIVGDELTVDYYHNVCIYKITGIGKGVDENADSANEGNGESDTSSST